MKELGYFSTDAKFTNVVSNELKKAVISFQKKNDMKADGKINKEFLDNLGKAVGNNYEALRAYVINIYKTLLTRGIHGALVYVCDPDLREYLRPYFQSRQM